MEVTIKIDPRKLIIIEEDHGGYLVGRCVVCGSRGWLDGKFGHKHNDKKATGVVLKHGKNCPLNDLIL